MNQDRDKLKLSAILSADVVGYSRLMEEDQSWTIKNLEENKTLISELVEEYKGRVVDAPGDNILAEFSSITNAVECAVKIQQELKKKNANIVENRRMEFRIGINLGEVFEENGKIYGSGVNIAARIEGLSKAGGICISGRTYDHIKSKIEAGYEYLGEHTVKNISEPIGVYRMLTGPENTGKAISERKKSEVISCQKNITIAVLPFDNLSPEKDQEYFVDGLTEEILNYISKISGLHVTSKTSSFAFKKTDKTIQEIAKILGRDYILEGSVRKAGNSLRITAQLIHLADDRHIWSEAYNRELKDIFKIQEDIALSVADKLKLTIESLKLLGGTENIVAYEKYLNAKGLRSTDLTVMRQALVSIDAAIDLDPKFALAWVEKARNHTLLSVFGPYNRAIVEIDTGLIAVQKAMELEPKLAEGYIYLGYINAAKREWIAAEYNFSKALELIDESLSGDHDYIIVFNNVVGKFKRAQEYLEKMRRNDPINERFLNWYYFTFSLLGDRQGAEDEYKSRGNLISKGWSTFHNDFITFTRIGFDDVVSSDEILPSNPIFDIGNKYFDSPKKGLGVLRRNYKSDSKLSSMYLSRLSLLAAYFGDTEFALEVLEKGTGISSDLIPCWFPVMKKVRKLPRFKEFLRKIGLIDYWKKYGWPDNNLCHPVGNDDFMCE